MSRVTQKGQITIPKTVREEMGLHPGDEVSFEESDEGYVLRKDVEDDAFERWRGVAETETTVEERMEALRGRR
jgi:AbrB family looped-hinge helix DNA binding protein